MTTDSFNSTNATLSQAPSEISLLARRKSLMMRLHCWAALLASPLALIAAFTGMLYIFVPQIEQALYGHVDRVQPVGQMKSLDQIIVSAQQALPALAPFPMQLKSVQPPFNADDSVKLLFIPAPNEHHGHNAHAKQGHDKGSSLLLSVNPYSGEVLGSQQNGTRFKDWSADLHSNLLQGENWRWMIELAASWLLIALISGVYLWWPRGNMKVLPQAGKSGRNAWKQWHAFLGVSISIMSLIIVLTGLTWSKFAGEQIRLLRDVSGQTPPRVPAKLHSTPQEGQSALTWQQAWNISRQRAPQVTLQLTAPQGENGVWRASAIDRSQPFKRFDLVLDRYSGESLYYSGWGQQTAFGQATTVGIPFHRGEFGWWNQALLLIFGLGVVFSLVSGWVMAYMRWRQQGKFLPRLVAGAWRSLPVPVYVVALALCGLFPLLAISGLVLVLVEMWLAQRQAN